ncbi:MAG: hypothetical protein K0R25_1336 [Rickettsiaceae bacterium]|jgi:hypothetical protein|nr:hypothetical protein [Rickettsiaceae bacterium]
MKILFITEKNVIDGKAHFGSSNDLLLIYCALKQGFEIYLTTPKNIETCQDFSRLQVLKLPKNPDLKLVEEQIKKAFHRQVINCLLTLPFEANQDETNSKILFSGTEISEIDIKKIPIFNRAEPVSLTDFFYDILISLQKNGAKILPNPSLNKILGDKLAIYAIHYNKKIDEIDLLEGIDFSGNKNQISFESRIIKVSSNKLSAKETEKFYDLILKKDFSAAQKLFADEYEIFMQGAKEYVEFHRKLNDDSIIKPANYFGGAGVVVAQNQQLDLEQAIKNITQSFLSITQDSQKNHAENSPTLSEIIVQERATEAHLGDLRIVMSGKNLQGIFIRVNRNFENSKANNLHFGGHPESLFKHYSIDEKGINQMIEDMKNEGCDYESEEVKKAEVLHALLSTINFLRQIKIFDQYPIIGIDALLTKDKNNTYRYGINEINLTSPMGQTQLLVLQMAVQFSNLATEILQENDFEIKLKKYQILPDYFKDKNFEAREILLQSKNLQSLIDDETEILLANNIAHQTISAFK